MIYSQQLCYFSTCDVLYSPGQILLVIPIRYASLGVVPTIKCWRVSPKSDCSINFLLVMCVVVLFNPGQGHKGAST